MALDTVQDFVDRARVLLQDTIEPYRYSNDELVGALNSGLLESRRLRPDFYLTASIPSYRTDDLSEEVSIDDQYKVAFIYYMVGHAHLRDEEDTTDQRATIYLNKFLAQLQVVQS